MDWKQGPEPLGQCLLLVSIWFLVCDRPVARGSSFCAASQATTALRWAEGVNV